MRCHLHKHYVWRQPTIAWHVQGRKLFDTRFSPKIRAMWKVGDYRRALATRRTETKP